MGKSSPLISLILALLVNDVETSQSVLGALWTSSLAFELGNILDWAALMNTFRDSPPVVESSLGFGTSFLRPRGVQKSAWVVWPSKVHCGRLPCFQEVREVLALGWVVWSRELYNPY